MVLGKADTAAVELSDTAARIGGFVLDGESADDISGASVSGAGDVKADGMDDLIIGVRRPDRRPRNKVIVERCPGRRSSRRALERLTPAMPRASEPVHCRRMP